VLGPLWVWIFLSEQPSTATLAGGAIVLAAVGIQARSAPVPPQEAEGAVLPPPP
jgi:drug/metabolite transporter (DMT)-like permease